MDIVRNGELEATNYFFGIGDQRVGARADVQPRRPHLRPRHGLRAHRRRVDDLEQTLADLKEQGIEPEREPYRVREGGSLICFVQDPDGYRIELIDRSGEVTALIVALALLLSAAFGAGDQYLGSLTGQSRVGRGLVERRQPALGAVARARRSSPVPRSETRGARRCSGSPARTPRCSATG